MTDASMQIQLWIPGAVLAAGPAPSGPFPEHPSQSLEGRGALPGSRCSGKVGGMERSCIERNHLFELSPVSPENGAH